MVRFLFEIHYKVHDFVIKATKEIFLFKWKHVHAFFQAIEKYVLYGLLIRTK